MRLSISRRPVRGVPCGLVLAALLGACASSPSEKPDAVAPVATTPSLASGSASAGGPPSARATADFNRALVVMRGNNATEAELQFKQMTLAYPQLAAPYVNLGILYRKGGRLDQSEEALKGAVERNAGSALAWNELGATQRLRGEFPDAAASYEHAIASDANYAPAYRNLGVVSDLYLGDPERALSAFERYKELTGEDRPVTSWIAELRQRTGKPPLKPNSSAAAPNSSPAAPNTGQPAPASGRPAPPSPDSKPASPAPKTGG